MSWEDAALEKGREIAGPHVPEVLRETIADVALEGAKAAMEALDQDTLSLIKTALEPAEYPLGAMLKAVVEVLPLSGVKPDSDS